MFDRTRVGVLCLLGALVAIAGCGSGGAVDTTAGAVVITTETIPTGGAGELYNTVLACDTEGGVALPDAFEVAEGSLPPGVRLVRDRVDADGDGLPDPFGEFTGNVRLLGYPSEPGTYSFTVVAVSTGDLGGDPAQPDIAAYAEFTLTVGDGSIQFISPTAAEGTVDPAVPAFPDAVDFVNPADPHAFFAFAFFVAGGSGHNVLNVYLPRELELSVFDSAVVDGSQPSSLDADEAGLSGDAMDAYFADGGLFVLQAGERKVQIGGFQSPRGKVGTLTQHAGGPGLDPQWFQKAPEDGGPARNSRRDRNDLAGLGSGDTTLGTPVPVMFSDYFDARYEGTDPAFNAPPLQRRKYPFTADQYHNAFFVGFTPGVDTTELRFRVIGEAIDTRGTVTRDDDILNRKAYLVQVKIPSIRIDTIALPGGTAGLDYTELVTASGGVPPLTFALEGADGVLDDDTTPGAALSKAGFGVEIDAVTGRFFGVPRASGTVELSVVVSANIMNPMQGGASYVATGIHPGEYNGTNPDTGMAGAHRTWQIPFAAPSAPFVTNTSLAPGDDGVAYPGDRIVGAGGVPRLVPDPVGFVGTYPASQAARNYEMAASYVRDASYGAAEGTVDPTRPLPRELVFDGDAESPNCGTITGITTDRGFHPITFTLTDFYLGDAGAPSAANRQSRDAFLPLSVSPDTAVYLRGASAADGGTPSGLLDATAQMAEARMAPLFLAGAIHRVDTGGVPALFDGAVPRRIDFLPVMLCNGGSDAHVDKSVPSISGTWPAESNKLDRWWHYSNGYSEGAWKHLQQETCWIQTPTANHARIYLWGETKIKRYSSGDTSGALSKRYQQFDPAGKRGILVQDPLTGDVWIPAILSNAQFDGDGSQFGAEFVLACTGTSPNYYRYGYIYSGYHRYYNYIYYGVYGDREVRLQGLGSYIEPYEQSSSGRASQGRTAVSVAVSADGIWAATAMPGGDEQKILLWRTDKQPIPAPVLARPFVTALDGRDAQGNTLPNSACIFSLGGESASGVVIGSNQRYLLPDSLMFVRDGLLFLNERQLDYLFGLSLVDGHLSAKSVNARTSTGAGTGPTANAVDGQYIPDQDYLRGQKATCGYAVQFSFTGNDPGNEEGPDKVAFVAGDSVALYSFADYPGSYTSLSSDAVRKGSAMEGNRNKALLFLETSTSSGGGLDLAGSIIKDLTGDDSRVYGDLLTPGRPGEELDFLAVSPDGNHVAVVRDIRVGGESRSSYYSRTPVFATASTSSTSSYYIASDDLLIVSTTGADMDSGTAGTQPVLYFGSGNYTANYSGTPAADAAAYASARPYFNAKGRRINGVRFAPDNRTLFVRYAGDNTYWTKYFGGTTQYAINSHPGQSSSVRGLSAQITLRIHFRNADGSAVDFPGDAGSFMKNNLAGLSSSGISQIGDTSVPFTVTNNDSQQQFWASFRSANGNFQYFISDQIAGRNFLVGFNISGGVINGHAPFVPFTPHDATVGFEQFDVNSWNYENRFFSVPAGVVHPASGRDGAGLVFLVGSASSAGATSATDLEVYAFDANTGGNLVSLTSDATDGTANAINHLNVSADGNTLVAQRCRTTSSSNGSRATLNGANDLIAVTNVHAAVFDGAAPNAFVLSADQSHGSTVAFVGERSATGPLAVVYSAGPKGANTSWDDRTLKVGALAPGLSPQVLDATASHYVVLGGTRRLDDDPSTSD